MSAIRSMLEERERRTLSSFATLSAETKGRDLPIAPCDMRTEFQRDRDRIIHCKAFRRLMHKTQVFLSPEDDHYRTRLTHTLEVMQIARTIARALRLNEDLCEAIALGHDLGHTPFGHAGEEILRSCYSPEFTHYKQSLRVVEKLENGGRGLNLTWEVRDGIVNHTGHHQAATLEGVVVKFADRIAYINHDIDDAIRAGVIRNEDIPAELCDILGRTHSERINTMVTSVVRASEGKNAVCMDDTVGQATEALRDFMFQNVYLNPIAKKEDSKAKRLLEDLYDYFLQNPDRLPEEYACRSGDSSAQRVCDYISGMTDRYAINMYTKIHIPQKFRG